MAFTNTREAVTAIFIGYYDRAPAPNGLNYWVDDIETNGFTVADVARAFAVQPESQALYPGLTTAGSGDLAADVAFVTAIFQNLFGRDPNNITENGGADNFWVAALQGGADVGQLIIDIVSGAQGTDLAIIQNKIEVGLAYADASEAAGVDTRDSAGDTILDNVDEDDSSVAAALETIEAVFPDEGTPGEERLLTSGTDVLTGTENNDTFNAYMQQNELVGGVSNSLSSADRLDGGAGTDRLYAELTNEFVGLGGSGIGQTDVQPRSKNIEEIDIEARDGDFDQGGYVTLDAKNITDHDEIGSYYSDGDLKIENVTTLNADGSARNTSDITVTMDHTDNFNSDGNASDLEVLFDNDYLLAGEVRVGTADFFLLDQDAELRLLRGQAAEGRLDEIDKNGIRFEINGQEVVVEFDGALLDEAAANEINDHDAFIAALQPDLIAKIAAGDLPEGTEIVRFDYTTVIFDDDGLALNRAGLQDGSFSDLIPSIRVVSGDGSPVTPLGFTAPDEITGEFNIFGRFDDFADETDEPITVDIELHKAGRGGEGGDLVVGGKANNVNEGIAGGIEVFNITVDGIGGDGASAKPSNVGTITSTLGALKVVNIATDAAIAAAAGGSYASLVVRNGFDEDTNANVESGDLQLVNANSFLGNLTLGDIDAVQNAGRITNLDTLTALGGGNVEFNALIDGNEVNQDYTYQTGSGNDTVRVEVAGDALDFADSGLDIQTGGGNDSVVVNFAFDAEDASNNQLNQAILDNVLIQTGSGNDTIDADGVGVANILAGDGDDTIYTDGGVATAVWAFNFDNIRADANAGGTSTTNDGLTSIGQFAADDLPGVQTSLAYIGGAEITVTLSGAGDGDYTAGGGVMSQGIADAFDNGYENTVTIGNLINGNTYYGDQRDINAAILDAINNDPVLNKLLVASIASNNTLIVQSLTSGVFDPEDLEIKINNQSEETAAVQADVVTEAQAVFQDSDISDLFTANVYTGTDVAAFTPDLTSSTEANEWYDGLSADGDDIETTDNLHTAGSADATENDNVIDGGAGDDVIVLSTDAVDAEPTDFTVSSNNALINGASNETVVMTGANFGNDTVMNFTAFQDASSVSVDTVSTTIPALTVFPEPGAAVSVVVLQGVLANGDDLEVELVTGSNEVDVANAIIGAINAADGSNYTASGTAPAILLTAVNDSVDSTDVDLFVADRDSSGNNIEFFTAADLTITLTAVADAVDIDVSENAGIDFLDFTAYLTSLEDFSGTGGSAVSNRLIEVDLDFDASDVEANDVVLVDYDPTTAADFDSLSGSDIAALFNNDDGTGDYDTLSDAGGNFEVENNASAVDVVGGVGKAILMVHNEDNDGEYKVFELTWDAAEDDGDEGVSATLLGSLDFGENLEDEGLDDVNIVGTGDYDDLITNGFF